jgi:hypothetical protein
MTVSFLTWSIADLWDWLAHIPTLGFLLIFTTVLIILMRMIGLIK